MLGGNPKPGRNRVLFVPLHPRQATDANAFGDERQGLNDLLFGRPATIEDRPFGLGEGLLAGLAPVSLTASLGFTGLLDVPLRIGLQLALVWTGCVWTEIANPGQSHHHPS